MALIQDLPSLQGWEAGSGWDGSRNILISEQSRYQWQQLIKSDVARKGEDLQMCSNCGYAKTPYMVQLMWFAYWMCRKVSASFGQFCLTAQEVYQILNYFKSYNAIYFFYLNKKLKLLCGFILSGGAFTWIGNSAFSCQLCEQHTKGPDIWLNGETTIQSCLRCCPFDWELGS